MNAMSEISPAVAQLPQGETSFARVGGFRTSPGIASLAEALAKAQAEFPAIHKNRTVTVQPQQGRSYSFDYATLDGILDALRPVLAKHGLSIVQIVARHGAVTNLVTRLMHSSGDWIEGDAPLPGLDKGPQAFGSALTYLRRYSVSAMLGVSTEADDDGNEAQGNQARTAPRKSKGQQERPRDDAANPWIVVSRDGEVKDLADARAWVAEWKLRLGAVERAKNGGPADKRRTIMAMMEANAGALARLHELGHEAAVQEVGNAQNALMVRLDELEHAR